MLSGTARTFLLAALAVTTVILYACALPLWEGWDEPFHYGYVESLAVFDELPVLGKSTLTGEIAESLVDTPLPRYLANSVPGAISFSEWHLLPKATRAALRVKLLSIPPSARYVRTSNSNYEAQQTPLAYLLLTPFDYLFAKVQLLHRVLLLRIIESSVAMLVLFFGLQRLACAMQVPEPFRTAAIFCCVSTETLWASLAHIGNDAVTIALTVWFCALLTEDKKPLTTGIVLAAGILAKAYFLAFAPVFYVWLFVKRRSCRTGAAVLPVLIAGPWYLRNIYLYHSISGTQETVVNHVTFASALSAIHQINWLQSISVFWRASIWTGNWSFITFSKGLSYAEALLMLTGLAMCALTTRSKTGWVWAAATSWHLRLCIRLALLGLQAEALWAARNPGTAKGLWRVRGY